MTDVGLAKTATLTPARVGALVCFAAIGALAGCHRPAKSEPPSIASALRVAREAKEDIELPQAKKVSPEPASAPHLIVSKSRLSLLGDPYPIATIPKDPVYGFAADDKRDGRMDVIVTPLSQAIHWKSAHEEDAGERQTPESPLLVIVADAHTTFRIASEVVATIGLEYRVAFAARTADAAAPAGIVPLGAPRSGMTLRGARERFTIRHGADGVTVAFGERTVANGCQDVGPGPTIPAGAALDYEAVTTCLARIHKEIADTHGNPAVGATPDTDLTTYLKLLEAVLAAGYEDIEVLALRLRGGS